MNTILWCSVIILALIRRGGSKDVTDYCQSQWNCAPSVKHFMCEFGKNKNTEKCSKIEANINDKQRKDILKVINDFRQVLARGENPAFPDGATDIRQVSWDFNLEKFAEVYGTQCGSSNVPDLDPCAKTQDFQYGTRVLWGVIQNSVNEVITGPDGWASQVPEPDAIDRYVPVDGIDQMQPNYGRFTMMVWASTYKIGCSIIKCTCDSIAGPGKLVCFFGPSGNIEGQRVFQSGQACSSCPADTACKSESIWSKLCARQEDPYDLSELSPATSIHSTYMTQLILLTASVLLAKQ